MRINQAARNHKLPTLLPAPISKMSSTVCISTVLVLLTCLPHLSAANHSRLQFDTLNTKRYTGRDCTEEWCGETWRSNRILYYNLTLNVSLVKRNQTVQSFVNICENGEKHSSDCTQVESSVETKLVTVREETLHRTSDEPTIVNELDSPELQHHYLLSDNMELDIGGPRQVSPLYPANQTKIWQLKIPRGCKMFISFQEFAIESSDQCKNDYFSVQTSKDPDDVVAFCDSLHEMEIKFRRRVQFTLHSDHSVNNGKLAAHVCLSKMESDRNDCDCFVSERRRRAALSSSSESQNGQQAMRERRLEALHRLQANSS